jgi:hypothetical protein
MVSILANCRGNTMKLIASAVAVALSATAAVAATSSLPPGGKVAIQPATKSKAQAVSAASGHGTSAKPSGIFSAGGHEVIQGSATPASLTMPSKPATQSK